MRSFIWAATAVLGVCSASAATFRNAVIALTAPPENSGCAAPLPQDYFESTDQNMVFWFDFANMDAGDVVTLKWTTTAGKLDSSSKWQPLPSGGGHCFWLTQPLSGNSASALAGIWNYNILVNNVAVYSKQIQVVGPNDTSINRGGVVNTASGVSRSGMIAPGSLVSIYGNNLAPFEDTAYATPLSTNLDGVTVTFNGTQVGIVAIAPGEVDVQAPWGIPSDTAFVQVNNNGVVTNTERVRVASSDPGIFFDHTNNNLAAVYRFGADGSDGGWVGPGNPLLRGDTAVFLATGLGAVADPPANFDTGNSDSTSVLPVQLRFGDAAASGAFASLADDGNPLDVGVWWVYCTVPNEAPNGDTINVAIGAGAAASNVAAVPIAGAAPAVAAPNLLSIGGYPAVNATGGYNPASAISISASGVYTNVSTYVKFADSTGYSAILPALAVYSDRVISMVPPYLNQTQHKTTAGTVQCSILQVVQGQLLASNSQTIQIAALTAAPGAIGRLTAQYLATLAQDARTVNGGYIYKAEISNGKKFAAVSATQAANQLVTGLQPLVGSAEEMATGSGGSITIGSYTLDSNSVALLDALIAASLRESAKAYQAPPIVTGENAGGVQSMLAGGGKPQSTILGSLATYFGKVAQCNMPWNQMSDEVNGTSSNCPTFGQALATVGGAAVDSLREAVDSTFEDAKRFAKGPGLMLTLIAGGPAVDAVEGLVNSAAVVQAATHLTMSVMENRQDATADQQAAQKTIQDEGIRALAGQVFEKVVGPILGVAVGAVSEDVGENWQKFLEDEPPTPEFGDFKVFSNLLDTLTEAPEKLEGPSNETNSDGTNSLDTSVDNAPSVDYNGKATNGSGTGLQNVGVALTDGNGTDAPIAAGATTTNGAFDLAIPAGASVPSSAIFQITALDESGNIATFDGINVNLANTSQSIGTTSISYDPDDDNDDDSDGSEFIPQHPRLGQSVHGATAHRAVRPRTAVTRPAAVHRPAPRPGRMGQRKGAPRRTVRTLAP